MKYILLTVCMQVSSGILLSQNIIEAEYFIDIDPGGGNGINIPNLPLNDTISFSVSISTASLLPGFHFVCVRVKNDQNVWSLFTRRAFYIHSQPIESAELNRAEYFIDTDPGVGNGINIPGFSLNDTINFPVSISTTGLSTGFHHVSIRVRDDEYRWSMFAQRTFYLSLPPVEAQELTKAEYFIGTDPGVSGGDLIMIPADDTIDTNLNLLLDAPIGQYYLGTRVKDIDGHWSHFKYDTLTIALSLPEDTIVFASTDQCSRTVTNIDAETYNNQSYTYVVSGATTASGNGTVSGISFNVGISTVTYALVSNPNVSGAFTVTVIDDQLPTITCPSNVTQGSDEDICGAVINYTVNFNDNCPDAQLALLSGINSGSEFPLGTTVNTFRVVDDSGNSTTCSFTVTISDDDAPSITCPSNITLNADPGVCSRAVVMLGNPITSDNCSVANISNNAPSGFPVGTTNIIWTVTDVNGLTASCIQSVTIIDNQPPTITCPSNILAFAGPNNQPIVVNYNLPVYNDNCTGSQLNQTTGLPSGSLFPPGITTNTFVVTDANGLTSSCSFSVTVRVGRVGVNTVSPLAMLHVADSSVLYSGPSTLPANPSALPTSGSSTRVLWYADKAAWRSGYFDYVRWNKDSVGIYSFAANYNTTAKGIASSAFGLETIARGDHSTAFGGYVTAAGKNSISIGNYSLASGEASVTIGSVCTSSGHASASINDNCISTGDHAFSSGFATKAYGNVSSAFGNTATARGDQSACFGSNTMARAFGSLTAGRFNDTTATSTTNWNMLDPLFIIGNSNTASNRKNAMTVLKNGDMGLHAKAPLYRLHITNDNAQSGGMNEGILIENINATFGEAAISFRTNSLPATRKWIIGQNQDQTLSSCYRSSFVIDGIKMRLDTLGFFGVTRLLPQAMLHVMRSDSSGGPFSSNALAIFESPFVSYLQLSHPSNMGTGILSGNQSTPIRSAIYFEADSSIQFAAGGDQIRMTISGTGNVGIATEEPEAKLDVSGDTRIGPIGTTFQQLIKHTYNFDIPQILPGDYYHFALIVNDIEQGGTVFISPAAALPSGLIFTSQVLSDDLIQFRFINANTANVNPGPMDFYFVHIY